MSAPLYFYPAYQSIKTLRDPQHVDAEHWFTFWISACILENVMPVNLPWWINTPAIGLMYLPDTTLFVRENILLPGAEKINEYIPVVKQKGLELFDKYRPRSTEEKPWYKFW